MPDVIGTPCPRCHGEGKLKQLLPPDLKKIKAALAPNPMTSMLEVILDHVVLWGGALALLPLLTTFSVAFGRLGIAWYRFTVHELPQETRDSILSTSFIVGLVMACIALAVWLIALANSKASEALPWTPVARRLARQERRDQAAARLYDLEERFGENLGQERR